MERRNDAQPKQTGGAPYRIRAWKGNRPLQLMLLAFVAYSVILAFHPTRRSEWALENILIVVTAIVLGFTYKRFKLSNLCYGLILLFLAFHTYGAHYTYTGTPFDRWLKSAIGTERSYYDRVVHFLFGFLLAYPVREWFVRLSGVARIWGLLIPVAVLTAMSSFFEILEMWIALILKNQLGQDYVGLQGDVWDSIKDIQMGLAGAVLAAIGLYFWYRRQARQ